MIPSRYSQHHAELELCQWSTDELIERYFLGLFLTYRQHQDIVRHIQWRRSLTLTEEIAKAEKEIGQCPCEL